MPTYHFRVVIDVSDRQEHTIRTERGLADDASVLPALRDIVWEDLTAAGADSDRWGRVAVT